MHCCDYTSPTHGSVLCNTEPPSSCDGYRRARKLDVHKAQSKSGKPHAPAHNRG